MIAHYSGKVKPIRGMGSLDGLPEELMDEMRDARRRRKLGRPPKLRDEVRSERVVSFITRGEFDTLLKLAECNGELVSAVVHRILRSALGKENEKDLG
jgi:hypothetical protein